MGKFDGILICTDLDGTLLKNDKTISSENIEAIEYFKKCGGLFTIVTGRMPQTAFDICKEARINAPFGCINGGGLYDYYMDEYIWKLGLDDGFYELIELIDEKLPNVGIQVNTFNNIYFSKENSIMELFRQITKTPNIVKKYDEIEKPIAKILFGIETEEEMKKAIEILNNHPLAEKFDFIRSEKSLYEILPKGIGKGTAILKLCEYLNIDVNKTIAVGDYDNDISMFKAAGVGIAVKNACKEALAAADYITVSNEESAIAKVIYDLEKGKYIL